MEIVDDRNPDGELVEDMPSGTWFSRGTLLLLKTDNHLLINMRTGLCELWNESWRGHQVAVQIRILRPGAEGAE